MGVALYTSRVALQVLGVSDYGLYNVVGGVVAIRLLFTEISVIILRYSLQTFHKNQDYLCQELLPPMQDLHQNQQEEVSFFQK